MRRQRTFLIRGILRQLIEWGCMICWALRLPLKIHRTLMRATIHVSGRNEVKFVSAKGELRQHCGIVNKAATVTEPPLTNHAFEVGDESDGLHCVTDSI